MLASGDPSRSQIAARATPRSVVTLLENALFDTMSLPRVATRVARLIAVFPYHHNPKPADAIAATILNQFVQLPTTAPQANRKNDL